MIRVLENEQRALRLVHEAVAKANLNLEGLTVLTEVGTGPFVLTPLIAAVAGANVIAVTRDSRFGAAKDVLDYANGVACRFGIDRLLTLTEKGASSLAQGADIITNLQFVRPIDRDFVSTLKASAMICLMWSPWEFRDEDVDRAACSEANIPIVGTNEEHPDIRTLEYVGLLALKLLLERQIELLGAKVHVIASNPFGRFIYRALQAVGAVGEHLDPTERGEDLGDYLRKVCVGADAIVLAEHRDPRTLIGLGGLSPQWLADQGTEIIHISGVIAAGPSGEIKKHPPRHARFGTMTLTTDYLGPKPVIDLHTGGLKVGEIVSRALQRGASAKEAIKLAEDSGYGLALP